MFSYFNGAVGAFLLHLATSNFLYNNGRVLGCSSILAGVFSSPSSFNVPVIGGMVIGAGLISLFFPQYLPTYSQTAAIAPFGIYTSALSGLLTGLGTKLGSGCTSGHMLCGIPRLSLRSLVAAMCFSLTGMVTTYFLGTAPDCGGSCAVVVHPSGKEVLQLGAVLLAAIASTSYLRKHSSVSRSYQVLNSLLSGLLFGSGLLISGLANPGTTLGFLALPTLSKFNPSLLMVVLFGMLPNLYDHLTKGTNLGPSPAVVASSLPTMKQVTPRLIIGSCIFGIGWGLCGICPGPGVVSAVLEPSTGLPWLATFLVAYNAGSYF